MSNEKPLHQVSAQGKIPRCQFHSVEHLACTAAVQNSEKFSLSVVCVRQFPSRVDSALGTFLAASPSCPELHTRAWSLPGVGSSEPHRRWELLRWLHLPWRPTRARALSPRHPAPPKAPWLSACPCRASARPWHRRRGPASTERAPCRRRDAPPPFRRAHPQHQVPARLAPKWGRWTSTAMPKPLIPLHIPGTAVITRRRSPFTATASGCL